MLRAHRGLCCDSSPGRRRRPACTPPPRRAAPGCAPDGAGGPAGLLQFAIRAADGSRHWLNCTAAGATVAPPPSLGISGSLECPAELWYLCDAGRCPSRCFSNGQPDGGDAVCHGGIC
eukprot:7390139-Prymnesium_polylepis.3